MRIRILLQRDSLICVLSCVVFYGISSSPMSARATDWPSDFEYIARLIDSGDELTAWNTLWKWAETRHEDALFAAAGGILEGSLSVPGAPTDSFADYRFVVIFAIFGMDGSVERRQMVAELAEFLDPGPRAGHPFLNCLRGDEPEDVCIDLAIRSNTIPSFEDFRDEVIGYQSGR